MYIIVSPVIELIILLELELLEISYKIIHVSLHLTAVAFEIVGIKVSITNGVEFYSSCPHSSKKNLNFSTG